MVADQNWWKLLGLTCCMKSQMCAMMKVRQEFFWRHKCQSSDREILRGKFPYLEVDTRKGEGCE